MHEHPDTTPSMPRNPPTGRSRFGRWLLLATLLMTAAVTGGIASRAIGQHAYGPFMGGPLDPARVEDRADRMTRHVAIEIDASNEQQEKLRAIVKSAVKDLLPIREKSVLARERAQTLLTGPAIDRAAIEQFRTEQMALADAASRRFAQALGDAAEVLTPEQRRKLHERLTEMRERWDFWHRWHRG
jgi:Spy/CpxP family protein refolding chaperone